jgi:hypothetical protein
MFTVITGRKSLLDELLQTTPWLQFLRFILQLLDLRLGFFKSLASRILALA